LRYEIPITVPAGTAEVDAQKTSVKITPGILRRVSVYFPPGCAGNVKLKIFYQEWQLGPVNRDGYLVGDGGSVEWEEFIPLEAEPLELNILSWNEDSAYEHSVSVGFVVLPRHAVLPEEALAEALSEFQQQLEQLFWGPPPT
jgi:hypothetical protein